MGDASVGEKTVAEANRTARSLAIIGKIAHTAVNAYAQSLGEIAVEWEDLPAANRKGVTSAIEKIVSGEIAGPVSGHDAWMTFMVENGWHYGPVKSYEAKTHPQLRPWAELPIEQRRKDFLFHAVVKALTRDIE
jgi:hypothetical protein